MAETFRPETGEQVAEVVAWAAAEEVPLEVLGLGSKRGFGRPVQASHVLDLSGLAGITLYEPEELVLSARAGTPLAQIEAALAGNGQHLAFEPADLGPLLGGAPGVGSLGGMLACNLSGPRRIRAGAARDHFLGFHAVSGRGEAFKSGGRVVKNVTGYDLCKLLAGSYGTLAVMTEATVKVLPAAEKTRTVLHFGLDDEAARVAMSAALGSPHDLSGAAHLPATLAAGSEVGYVAEAGAAGHGVTALRVEGPGPSVEFRCRALREDLAGPGGQEELHGHNSGLFWRELRDVTPFARRPELPVWRVSVPPTAGPTVAARLAGGCLHYYDWGGGLVWLAMPDPAEPGEAAVRAAVAEAGGHATLVRASGDLRAGLPVFQPQDPAKAALSARVKESFDPNRVLNPGRIYADF
jgi:glycolate oxidase FAD binding subunit